MVRAPGATVRRMDALVSTDWLADHLDDADLRVLECTVILRLARSGPGYEVVSGLDDWAAGHIPNSAYADLGGALSDPSSRLRFTMPTAERFGAAMEAMGVGDATRVVLYDRRMTMWAARVWWMLRAFGFDDAAVLDGGWQSWVAEGRPVSTAPAPTRPEVRFTARPRPELVATKAEVLAAIGDEGTCIVNSLSPAQHRGEDLTYGRAGHIPGAVNVFAVDLLDHATHRYLPLDQLRPRFADALARPRAITYCGGGIAATSDAFTLWRLGHPDVAVYDGSLSEWVLDPAAPLVT